TPNPADRKNREKIRRQLRGKTKAELIAYATYESSPVAQVAREVLSKREALSWETIHRAFVAEMQRTRKYRLRLAMHSVDRFPWNDYLKPMSKEFGMPEYDLE